MNKLSIVHATESPAEAHRREEMLKQIRVEDRGRYIDIAPYPHVSECITVMKPYLNTAGGMAQSLISLDEHTTMFTQDDAERLGLALQQAAELARVLDAKFKEEHGIA